MPSTNNSPTWSKDANSIMLIPPKEFSFQQCLVFLGRSANECLHFIANEKLYKLIKIGAETILLQISAEETFLRVDFLHGSPDERALAIIGEYLTDWFDLDRDLSEFYQLSAGDLILSQLAKQYYGLRIIGIPDLFEALTWAVIGQQINLSFAYTLKKRFVEAFGEKFIYGDQTFWLYPIPEVVAKLQVSDLTCLQFTTKKSEYIIGIAESMCTGCLSREELRKKNPSEAEKDLLTLRGVGKWTANYVSMKCLKNPRAFPIDDVGLHNAIKVLLALPEKPTIEAIRNLAQNWQGHEAYATFYLWRSLY